MSDLAPTARTGLEAVAVAGRYGCRDGLAGVTLGVRIHIAIAGVIARRGMEAALVQQLRDAFGLDAPLMPRVNSAGPLTMVWTGPGQWLAMADGLDGLAFSERLEREFSRVAAVCELSDARQVIRVAGGKAREVLAKGVAIDLHSKAFGVGHAASTAIGHISVQLWQVDDRPAFDLAVGRSFAGSAWTFLVDSGAEFGVEIATTA